MKILLLSHNFNPFIGGIESVSEMLANEFYKAGHEVHVMTWTPDESATIFPYPIIRNPGFAKIISEHFWADVVFENNPCLRLSWPLLFIKRPSMVSLHTWINRRDGSFSFQDKLKIKRLKRAEQVTACSDAIRKRTFPSAIVIPNPYDRTIFTRLEAIEKDKDFVFLGRLVSDKGVTLAIEAINQIVHGENRSTVNKNIVFTIIGKGLETDVLTKLIADYQLGGSIRLAGPLRGKELVAELNRYQYILVPSKWEEPFGMVAIEGMACGCIPIVSNGGGLPEAVGKAGYIFERNNLDSLVDGIEELLQNDMLRTELRNEAPQHLAGHYVEHIAQRYLLELEIIAEKSRGKHE